MQSTSGPMATQEYRDELVAKGLDFYNNKLRDLLEPVHNSEYVVIHVDAEDYAVAKSLAAATRAMRRRHEADGRLIGLKIGREPEFGLAARLIAAEQAAAMPK